MISVGGYFNKNIKKRIVGLRVHPEELNFNFDQDNFEVGFKEIKERIKERNGFLFAQWFLSESQDIDKNSDYQDPFRKGLLKTRRWIRDNGMKAEFGLFTKYKQAEELKELLRVVNSKLRLRNLMNDVIGGGIFC